MDGAGQAGGDRHGGALSQPSISGAVRRGLCGQTRRRQERRDHGVTGGAMPDHRKQEELTEKEVSEEAKDEPEDPITSREALEQEVMEEGRSDLGEEIT